MVAALDRVHTLYMEYSLLSDPPGTAWQGVVAPALQVTGPGASKTDYCRRFPCMMTHCV